MAIIGKIAYSNYEKAMSTLSGEEVREPWRSNRCHTSRQIPACTLDCF